MYMCLWEGMAVMSLVPIDPSCATLSRGLSPSALAALLPSCPQSAHLQVPNHILIVRLNIQASKMLSYPVCIYSTLTLLYQCLPPILLFCFYLLIKKLIIFAKLLYLFFLFMSPKLVTSTAINLSVTFIGMWTPTSDSDTVSQPSWVSTHIRPLDLSRVPENHKQENRCKIKDTNPYKECEILMIKINIYAVTYVRKSFNKGY